MLIPKQIMNSYDVAGFNNQNHLASLGEFVSKLPEKSKVLEIGVGFGGSTWQMLDSLPKGCELHSCDTFNMNHPQLVEKHCAGVLKKHSHNSAIVYQMDVYRREGQRAAFDWAVSQHKRFKKTLKQVHHRSSLSVLEEDSNWDCVYIDGLHSYENVRAELMYLNDVTYICGDDYSVVHPGCKKAIDEFIERTGRVLQYDSHESGSGFWSTIKD